jgi:hypothetical protein
MKHIILTFLLITPLLLKAQEVKTEKAASEIPKWIFKSSPLALIDPFGYTLAIYAEQPLANQHALEYEAGYIINGGEGFQKQSNGYRLRASYRYYLTPVDFKKGVNFYMSLSGQYKRLTDKREDFLWRDNRSFQQKLPYTMAYNVLSSTFNIGVSFSSSKNQRIVYDFSMGLGVKKAFIRYNGLPIDASLPDIPWTYDLSLNGSSQPNPNELISTSASAVLAFKIGYILW